jgi:hypothetical protein
MVFFDLDRIVASFGLGLGDSQPTGPEKELKVR